MKKNGSLLLALLLTLCLALAACSSEPAAPAAAVEPTAAPVAVVEPTEAPAAPTAEPAPSPTEAPAAEPTWVAGTYTASSYGFGGNIVIELTLAEDGSIAAIAVDASTETPGLGLNAAPKLAEDIVAAQSLDVDGMTGATTSCTALKKAVEDALTQANALELYR